MARKPPAPSPRSASLSRQQIANAIPSIDRRIQEAESLNLDGLTNDTGGHTLDALRMKINTTLQQIFGADTIEYSDYSVGDLKPVFYAYAPGMDISLRGNIDKVRTKVGSALARLRTLREVLAEQIGIDAEGGRLARTARAYEGLDLHPEIERAASALYKDGHYANAVEASVKALNGLVRMRSGLEFDGTTLMERTFNPTTPVLKFNDLQDQSDKDEQKGFMMLFSGSVSGLRNPRAHSFIEDDPERALEFIAFVSLLAKLLDGATRA